MNNYGKRFKPEKENETTESDGGDNKSILDLSPSEYGVSSLGDLEKKYYLMGKPRYKSEFIMCPACRQFNYEDKERHTVRNGRLYEYFSYCPFCVKMNILLGEIHRDFYLLVKK